MKARTNTDCKECMHRKVCHKFDRPIDAVDKLLKVTGIQDNGIDIVVTCQDFDRKYPVYEIDYRGPILGKPMREDGK